MIDFYITEQTIRFASPVIAANSRDYLTARFHFSGEAWEGCSKWAHFRQGETVYDLNLVDDEISSGMHLNLSVGQWEVYLTGHKGESRITTVPVLLRVRESGLIDEPLHQIPLSVAEQVDSKANLALEKAKDIEAKLASGALDGKDFQILGYYGSLEELVAAVEKPERGDAYGVGMEAPYDIYVYDGLNGCWVNNGSIQGPKGDDGATGATFSPQIDGSGNLSWVNDKGLPNPQTVNLRGDKGDKGDKGDSGESPFVLAVKEGFSGTEATFNWSLAHIADHAAQHKAGGTDPLEVETDSIKAGAVTRSKLASDVKVLSFTNKTVDVSAWESDTSYTDFPYRAAVACEGVSNRHFAQVVFSPEAALSGSFAPVAVSFAGGVYIYASEIPAEAIELPSITCIPTGPDNGVSGPAGSEESVTAVYAGAGYHNSVYRGNFLGNAVSAEQFAAIKAGTFDGLYIGDYWTIGGVTYRIAAFDYYYQTGDTPCTSHHVTLVPDGNMYTHCMNDTSTTTGAYVGSKMYTEGLNQAKETISAAFGSAHVLNHRQFLQNATTYGYASGGSWYDSIVELMTEQNVYGCKVYGNCKNGTELPNSYTVDKSQYPLFAFRPDMISNRQSFLLRDVASDTRFAFVGNLGYAGSNDASVALGVRPAFSIIG